MSIKRRIWALPAISIVILSLGLAVSLYFSTASVNLIKDIEQVDYPSLEATKALAQQVQTVANGFKDVVAENDQKRLEQIGAQGDEVRAQLKRLENIAGKKAQARKLAAEFDDYFSNAMVAARLMLELEQGDVQQAIPRMQSSLKAIEDDLERSVAQAQQEFSGGVESSNDSVRKVMQTSIIVALVTVASLVVVSYFVIRTIWQQLGGEPEYARTIARAVAGGDLSMEIHAAQEGSVLAALKEMQGKLAGMVSGIKASATTMSEASAELAAGNADLSSRTDAQAANLEQTASAMGALTDTVKRNAENARQANQLAGSAASVAIEGGDVVGQVVATMNEINASSQEIADIISVIDGIAFQTNILALNAAVEAARAGEQGRGFAVVAAEVRNLAQRSAGAAKEIKELIGGSVEKVTQGTKLVDQAGTTMTEIVASVKRVTDIMGEIAAASEAQRSGIIEVSQAIGQMDQMTQQNSALVEEVAASTEALQDHAVKLNATLEVFKLAQRTGTSAAAPLRLPGLASSPGARLSVW